MITDYFIGDMHRMEGIACILIAYASHGGHGEAAGDGEGAGDGLRPLRAPATWCGPGWGINLAPTVLATVAVSLSVCSGDSTCAIIGSLLRLQDKTVNYEMNSKGN